MKKNAITLACLAVACVGALSTTSCSWLSCLTSDNPEECVIGKGIESAIGYLADAKGIDSAEKADAFASKWGKVQIAISNAQSLGVKVPDAAKKAYNDTLSRIVKHNYFNSEHLKAAMANAQYIK